MVNPLDYQIRINLSLFGISFGIKRRDILLGRYYYWAWRAYMAKVLIGVYLFRLSRLLLEYLKRVGRKGDMKML